MTIKRQIIEIVSKYADGVVFDILNPPNRNLGDYSINLAFKLEKTKGGKAIEWADKIRNALPPDATWLTFTRMGRKRSVAITTG